MRSEAEKLEQLVDGLTSRSLQGTVPLDTKWRDLLKLVESSGEKLSVSVARCYPMKNRAPDILPYDQTRVELKSSKDDYINASYVTGLSPHAPGFIVTQVPFKSCLVELYQLVWQEGVELAVSVIPQAEMGDSFYLPLTREALHCGEFILSLQSLKEMPGAKERVVNITWTKTRQTRALVHVELTCWPGPDLPSSPARLLEVLRHVRTHRQQQRSALKPVLVHCKDGGNKSGTVCALLALMAEVQATGSAPDLIPIVASLLKKRKGLLSEKLYLGFLWEAELYHLQETLLHHGVLSGKTKSHSRHPSLNFVTSSSSSSKSAESNNSVAAADPTAAMEIVPAAAEGTSEMDGELLDDVASPPWIEATAVQQPAGDHEAAGEDKKRPAVMGGLLANLDFSLAEIKLSDSPKKKKITKEDFLNPGRKALGAAESDPLDPLSQLNPLWSLK